MEPDLYRALRAKDLRRVRECLNDWGNNRRWIWWSGSGRALTPLHVACKGSNQDILAELLRHPEIGRSINESTDKASVTPLHVAAGSSSPGLVRLLLDAGADISSPSGDRSTPFHIACSRGRPETCAELLKRGSLLEARDAEERTPLLRSAGNGRADITKWLLMEGADPTAVDIHGNSALALSCRVPNPETAQVLLDGGADVSFEDSEGRSCIHLAAVSGRTELVDMMLAAMARSGQRLRDGGGCMLYDIVEHGLKNMVDLLTSRRGQELGINLSRRHPAMDGATPLHAAVLRGQETIVGELLARGADPNVGNDGGLSVLHFACATPDSQRIVKLLLRAGADPNAKDSSSCTPIYYAFVRGHDDLVHYMLSRGASLFRMDYDQAIRIACFYGMVQEVESLLWMEAEPSSVQLNKRDRDADFHMRVSSTVRDGIRELLEEAREGEGCDAAASEARKNVVEAARAAVEPWVGVEEVDPSETSSCTSADTTSTMTTVGKVWSEGGSHSYHSSCTSSADGSSEASSALGDQGMGMSERKHYGHQSSSATSRESSEFDDFVVPVLSSLENELLREGEVREPLCTGAATIMRRWGQLVSSSGKMNMTSNQNRDHQPGECSTPRSRGNGVAFGQVKERARATFAGVIKWATSPRTPRTSRTPRTPHNPPSPPSPQTPRSPRRLRSPLRSRGVVAG